VKLGKQIVRCNACVPDVCQYFAMNIDDSVKPTQYPDDSGHDGSDGGGGGHDGGGKGHSGKKRSGGDREYSDDY